MGRTAKELIEEIEKEGSKFTCVFLVCRFINTEYTEQVEHLAADKLEKINDIVSRGGIPFAMIGYVKDDKGSLLKVYSRPLKEYEGDAEALSLLGKVIPAIAQTVHVSGLTPTYLPVGQWI